MLKSFERCEKIVGGDLTPFYIPTYIKNTHEYEILHGHFSLLRNGFFVSNSVLCYDNDSPSSPVFMRGGSRHLSFHASGCAKFLRQLSAQNKRKIKEKKPQKQPQKTTKNHKKKHLKHK